MDGLDGIRTPGHLLPLALWTVVVWLAPAAAAWAIFRAMDLDLPWIAAWTVLAFVGVGISIPAAPGYVGVFHYAAVLALEIFDVPRPAALSYALVYHASQILAITASRLGVPAPRAPEPRRGHARPPRSGESALRTR